MPLFAFYCRDGENGKTLRERTRDAHLAYLEQYGDSYAVAGPLRQDGMIVGSLLVIDAADEEEARTTFERDPYFEAGVWQSIRASQFEAIMGDWTRIES